MVLRPSPAGKELDLKHMQDQVMRGVCYGNAMVFTFFFEETVFAYSPETVPVQENSK